MKKSFVNFLVGKPKIVFGILIVLLCMSLPGIGMVKEDFTYSIWYNKQDRLMKLFKQFQKKFGNDDQALIGIYKKEGITDQEHLDLIYEMVNKLQKLKDIVRVQAVTNTNIITTEDEEILIEPFFEGEFELSREEFAAKALSEESIKDVYIGQDKTFAIIALTSRPDFLSVPNYFEMTLEINKALQEYESRGYKFYRSGSIILTYWFKQVTIDDMQVIAPSALLMFVILLAFFYRKLVGVLIPFLIIISSVVIMMGLAGYLGHSLNTISSAAPTILLTVALADAVHLLTYYFYEKKRGETTTRAVEKSLNKNFYPTLITSITTFLGFVSFGTSKVVPVADLGVEVGLGVMAAWLVSFLIFSSFLLLFSKNSLRSLEETQEYKNLETPSVIKQVVANLIEKRKLYFGTTILIALICLFFSSKLFVSMDPIKQFSSSHIVPKDFYFIEEKMGSASTLEVMLEVPEGQSVYEPEFLERVEKFNQWIKKEKFVHKTASVLNIIKSMNQSLNQDDPKFYQLPESREKIAQVMLVYELGLPEGQNIEHWVSLEKDALRMSIFWDVHNSKQALTIIKKVNDYGHKNKLKLSATGKTPLFHNLTPYVVKTFFVSFLTALGLVTLIMVLLLGSLKLGLLTLIPNLIPLMIGGALVHFLQWQVDIGIVIVASVCLGIAVDDSIHILFEYRRLRKSGQSLNEAFETIFQNTLPALFITTLIICLGFGTFVMAQYLPNSRFGVLVAVILAFAFVADAILFPVIMGIFDKKVEEK